MSDLMKELQAVINMHSEENKSDTPDFLLASYLSECLKTWAKIVRARDKWYGFEPTKDLFDKPAEEVASEREKS